MEDRNFLFRSLIATIEKEHHDKLIEFVGVEWSASKVTKEETRSKKSFSDFNLLHYEKIELFHDETDDDLFQP